MIALELFSGTKSVSRVIRELGWSTVSLDIDPTHDPDLCLDIMDFDETSYSKDYFQFVWASPDCASYSCARSNAIKDRVEAMQLADRLVTKTRQIIDYFDCEWCIENPASSRLWKREVARGLLENSCVTSYCSFGMLYRKDTRIASSFVLNLPRCLGKGHCQAMIGCMHKEWAQRGYNLKRKGAVEQRSHTLDELHSIPSGLVEAILGQMHCRVNKKKEDPVYVV